MSKLKAALAWAARGFRVFPLIANGKEPIHDAWQNVATSDPDTIRALWVDPVVRIEREYNIGVLCNDMVVIDVDVKNGKDGHNEYMHAGGTYETLVVQTPSGGYHCYFEGPDSSNAPLTSAVDVRSHNGFVVAPGSTIDGVPYRVVVDRPLAFVPAPIAGVLRAPYERLDSAIAAALDSPASIEAGRRFLESAPVAIQGQRGDETTFITAARLVREMALSVDTATALLAEVWNPRCQPPWGFDELRSKVENASMYGTAIMGRLDPAVAFAGITAPLPPPSVFDQVGARFGNAVLPDRIPPRPWMIDRLLMLHETTLMLAPGSAGKSSLALAIAAHLAVGKDFGSYRTRVRCRSIVYNGEDGVVEQSRRLLAVCRAYSLDYTEVADNVLLLSADELDLRMVGVAGRVPVCNDTIVRQLTELAAAEDVGMIVYDPLVDVHDCDEGDNPQMNFVMKTIHRVSREANVCSLVLHHTTKAGSSRQEDRVGNMDVSRGASGIVYKARIAFTLMNATLADCETYNLQEQERSTWVRLDDAKMNLALASNEATWFRREGVALGNGDVVGVMKLSPLQRNAIDLRLRVADTLMSTMTANGQASMLIGQAVAVLKADVPVYANKTDTELRQKIEGMFATRVEVRGRTLHARREGEGSQSKLLIVME